jgi:hypothetical protein
VVAEVRVLILGIKIIVIVVDLQVAVRLIQGMVVKVPGGIRIMVQGLADQV